jgi:hypothetical protein
MATEDDPDATFKEMKALISQLKLEVPEYVLTADEKSFAPPTTPEFPGKSAEPAEPPTPTPPLGGPIWNALQGLKPLFDLVPPGPGALSRPGQCVAIMCGHVEKDLFPDAVPDRPDRDGVVPITYPKVEINRTVQSARLAILGLLPQVDIERSTRDLLTRALATTTPFLEADDRGSLAAVLEPTGLTREKQRNDSKLHALAAFLDAIRRQPFAIVRYALGVLRRVAIPPELLSVDPKENTVTFRSTAYPVSDITCHFVQLLIDADGGIVSTGDLKKRLEEQGILFSKTIRSDRLLNKLPKELVDAVITDQRGSRLDVDRLLTHA